MEMLLSLRIFLVALPSLPLLLLRLIQCLHYYLIQYSNCSVPHPILAKNCNQKVSAEYSLILYHYHNNDVII